MASKLKELLEVSMPDDPKPNKILVMQEQIFCAIVDFLNYITFAANNGTPKLLLVLTLEANIQLQVIYNESSQENRS